MFIKNVRVSNLLSFGPEPQEISDIRSMNLFIGRNGSGKSNALRLLGELPIEVEHHVDRQNVTGSCLSTTAPKMFPLSLARKFKFEQSPTSYQKIGDLRIEYANGGQSETSTDRVIEFKDGLLIKSSIDDCERFSRGRIESEWDSAAFTSSFRTGGDRCLDNAILNVGLGYIFQRKVMVDSSGHLLELKTQGENSGSWSQEGVFEKDRWPSGFLRVAKIIQQIVTRRTTAQPIVLLEEPELGLEPRAIRRFVDL